MALIEESTNDISQKVGILTWIAIGAIVVATCEIGARLDDLFFEDIPFREHPTFEGLFLNTAAGIRLGRPNAQWKKVSLNSFGFRSPEADPKKSQACSRWAFLGASETFGEPSASNVDYPAKLRSLVPHTQCVEIMNTAFPGLGPPFLPEYYRTAVVPYHPTTVFIYPSTHLYLGALQGRKKPPAPQQARTEPRFSLGRLLNASRFYERLRDSVHMPAFIQKRRLQKWIDNTAAGKPADWKFDQVPPVRLEYLIEDLSELIDAIKASGAEPVLMTHAIRATSPPRPEDRQDLFAMRVYVPQASEDVIAEFEQAADKRIRELAVATNVRLIDIAQALDGRRDQYIDLVHFTPAGHAEVARLIQSAMIKQRE